MTDPGPSQPPSVPPQPWQTPAGSPWASPGAPDAPPASPSAQPPQYGERLPAGQQPQYGPPFPQAPTGWTPPPKPGLIPLRPLTLGDILGGAFQVLRRNPKPTFGFALLMSLVTTFVVGIASGAIMFFAIDRIASAPTADRDAITAGTVALGGITLIVVSVMSVALTTLVQGIIAIEVVRGALGEKHTLGGLWRVARGRLLALVAWTLLVFAAVMVALLLIGGLVALVFIAAGTTAGIVTVVIAVLLVGLGGTALSLWLSTKLAFVPTAIVVERRSIVDAVRRSWRLTVGHFWRILGITLLVSIILSVALQIVSLPVSFLAPFASILVNPNDSPEASIAVTLVLTVLSLALLAVATAVTLVAQSAVPALLYLDVRMRSEGLDLELQRFVEDRAAGAPVPENPYLPPTA